MAEQWHEEVRRYSTEQPQSIPYDFQADVIGFLQEQLTELEAAARDSLKGGAHDGPCTNEGFEWDDSCELHVEASKRREERLRAALRTPDREVAE